MSVIDQAFVKAYSRRAQSSTTALPERPDSEQSPPDVSINPKSERSAIVWVDAVADQYLRRDMAHDGLMQDSQDSAVMHPRQSAEGAGSIFLRQAEGRARGSRPSGLSSPEQAPPASSTQPAATSPIIDQAPATPAASERPVGVMPSSASQATTPHSAPVSNILPLGAFPWINASSTLVDSSIDTERLSQGFFSESVIVQESYLPTGYDLEHLPQSSESPGNRAGAPTVVNAPSIAPAAADHDNTLPSNDSPLAAFKPFSPVWEVDAFEFSDTIVGLFGDLSLMKSIGFPLDRAVSEGLQTLLITSEQHGAGRTTVAAGIAIAAATAGLKVVLVEATTAINATETNSLADSLNLEIQFGWLEAVRGGISIEETAIHSIEDQLTVLPLVLPMSGLAPTGKEFRTMIRTLRQGFDLVIVDGPPYQEPAFRSLLTTQAGQSLIDAAIMVQDMRDCNTDQASRLMESMRQDGITGLGLVQNFV